jgi:hypothetical protein
VAASHLHPQALADQLVAAIPDEQLSFEAIIAAVARGRGRAIRLIPCALPGLRLYGVWIAGKATDFIFHETQTPRFHQLHIIAHELGHLLLGHTTLQIDETDPQALSTLLAQLRDPDGPTPGLQRALEEARPSDIERDAEQVAVQIQLALITRLGLSALQARPPELAAWRDYTAAFDL